MYCKICRRSYENSVIIRHMVFLWGGTVECYGMICEDCKNNIKGIIDNIFTLKDQMDKILKEDE